MDRLFFDTNVLLDVLEARAPWFPDATACLDRVRCGDCKGAMTALSLSDIAYIQRGTSTDRIRKAFRDLRDFLAIASLDQEAVDQALRSRLSDLEDTFQFQAALRWGATHLLTRNVNDFPKKSSLLVLTPRELWSSATNTSSVSRTSRMK